MSLLHDRLDRLNARIDELDLSLHKDPFAKVSITGELAITEVKRLRKERVRLKVAISSRRSAFGKNRSVLKRYR